MADEAPAISSAGDKVLARIVHLLGRTLGATGSLFDFKSPRRLKVPEWLSSPVSEGLFGGAIYVVMFCGLHWLLAGKPPVAQFWLPDWATFKDEPAIHLFWLSAWGGAYFAFATVIAQSTTSNIKRTIGDQIVPLLSEKALGAIETDLGDRFDQRRINWSAGAAALLAGIASAVALSFDFPDASTWQILYCSAGFSLLYYLSARSTIVARFYGTFAAHLCIDAKRIFPLEPLRDPLVYHISLLGRQILTFWFGIACSVLTLIPLFGHLHWFILLVVPTASFFSLAFGTIIFLRSEREISFVTSKVLSETIGSMDRDIAGFFQSRSDLESEQWKKMMELQTLREKLFVGGWSQNLLLRVLSVAAPFVGPAISFLSFLAARGK